MTHQQDTEEHHHHDPLTAGHGGDHVHPHASSHGHHHGVAAAKGFVASEAPPSPNQQELARGYGEGKVLFFDASSGIAGDMTVAALVSLGVPFSVVDEAVAAVGIAGYRLLLRTGRVGALGACKFDVQIDAGQHERQYSEIAELIDASRLPAGVVRLAQQIFKRLGEAEARVHGIPLEKVHFHEVGAVDAIADIVGAAAALDYLGATVVASPLPLGHGFVNCRHGIIPLPAPATVECLRGVPTYSAGIEAETVTPTGAAIIATVAQGYVRWPEFSPERVGWGAGSQVFADRTNVLRVVLGEPSTQAVSSFPGHIVLEANLDDMTGELVGHTLSQLMRAGALDAWAVPITMKKGRPGVVLSAIVTPEDRARLSELIIRETTTLGVRCTETARVERPRRMIDVDTRYGRVRVKVSEGPFGPAQLKPEFDDCARLAQTASVPVREVIAEALAAARGVATGL